MKDKIELLIKIHRKRKDLYSIILNDYRIVGLKWNDIYDNEAEVRQIFVKKENLQEALKGLFEGEEAEQKLKEIEGE